jgi:hypothetical protein
MPLQRGVSGRIPQIWKGIGRKVWYNRVSTRLFSREVETMRGRWSRNGLDGQMSVGRTWVSRWSSWLGLWLACVMVLPAFAQGRPDIVWMRGGHVGWVYSVVFSPDGSPSRGTQVMSTACRFRRMGACWRRGVGMHHSSCGVFRMVRWCAPSRGTQVGSSACRFRRMGACWRRGVGIDRTIRVVACVGWFAAAHPHGAHRWGLQRVVFAGWEPAGVGGRVE